MATKFPSLFVFFLLLLTFQEITTEATMCQAPSRIFRGLCFSRNNCTLICEKEGFLLGVCKHFKCMCSKDCNSSGGGGEGGSGGGNEGGGEGGEGDGGAGGGDDGGEDPGQGPPEDGPPEQDPPNNGDEPPSLHRKVLPIS